MKLKGDFVTNSSSSSFIGFGVVKTQAQIEKIIDEFLIDYDVNISDMNFDDKSEMFQEKCEMDVMELDEENEVFLGCYFSNSTDDYYVTPINYPFTMIIEKMRILKDKIEDGDCIEVYTGTIMG